MLREKFMKFMIMKKKESKINMEKRIQELEEKTDQQEQYFRCNCILIHGVTEIIWNHWLCSGANHHRTSRYQDEQSIKTNTELSLWRWLGVIYKQIFFITRRNLRVKKIVLMKASLNQEW